LRFQPVISERGLHDAVGAHPPAAFAEPAGQMDGRRIGSQAQQIPSDREVKGEGGQLSLGSERSSWMRSTALLIGEQRRFIAK
jgi:hypothetical protein